MSQNLPKKAVILQTDGTGSAKLPPKAIQVHGKPGKGVTVGHFIDERDGSIETVSYRMPDAPVKKGKAAAAPIHDDASSDDTTEPRVPVTTRPPVTKDGQCMIGDLQTDALHEALGTAEIDDLTLLGLFVLAASGDNVQIRTGDTNLTTTHGAGDPIADAVVANGVLVHDPETIRVSARRMLRYMLSLRQNGWQSSSGLPARIAGDAIGADTFLANMATQGFLSCLSKTEMERVASANGVQPRQTGKATRAAFIERFKGERFTYDACRFALSAEEQRDYAGRTQRASPDLSSQEDDATAGPDGENAGDALGDDNEAEDASADAIA
jgi:ParB family chromosome partitioning protein